MIEPFTNTVVITGGLHISRNAIKRNDEIFLIVSDNPQLAPTGPGPAFWTR